MEEDLSYADLLYQVDELYFSILTYNDDDEELFPISDEKYALQLHFQEMLMSSVVAGSNGLRQPRNSHYQQVRPTSPITRSRKERGESSSSCSPLVLCKICMDESSEAEMFKSSNCSHLFCRGCLSQYIGTKVRENIAMVKCPELECKGVLEPEFCQELIPKEVFERWNNALCESLIIGSNKFYCPFKDCSELMVNEGDEMVTQSECPSCRRLFCAQCLVAWHCGVSCHEYARLAPDEKGRDDLLLIEIAKSKDWKRCPKCKFYVEKNDGCQHLTCRCQFQFCYGCCREWSVACNGCGGES